MPNTKQAKKRMVTDDNRRMRNKTARTTMRSAMKKVFAATSVDEAQAAVPEAMKKIDKASKANVIHDNSAARKKSQLHRHIAGL